MLILTRNPGQSIVISDDIVVRVLKHNGNQVVLGIEAPKDVDVHREEVFERIQANKDAKAEFESLLLTSSV